MQGYYSSSMSLRTKIFQQMRLCSRLLAAQGPRSSGSLFSKPPPFYVPRTRLSYQQAQQCPQLTVCAAAASAKVDAEPQAAKQPKPGQTGAPSYDAAHIQVLQGLEPVRKRPGMYIGSTGQRGLHHLVYEILDNAIDEVQARHATDVWVELDVGTGWVTIRDNGRGIPTDVHPATGKSALETVLTVLHAGGKFGGDSSGYSVSGGLHGVGVSVVNALSSSLEVTVWRDGTQYSQRFSRGMAETPLSQRPAPEGQRDWRGTQVRFLYDTTIFSKRWDSGGSQRVQPLPKGASATFDPDTIRSRLRELAFLHSAATIRLRVVGGAPGGNGSGSRAASGAAAAAADNSGAAAEPEWEVFHYSGGLGEYVTFLNRDKEAFHKPVVFRREVSGVTVEVALQWCADSFSDNIIGFVNSIKTVDGGTHIDGLKAALTRTVNNLGRKTKALKEGDPKLSGEHIREGLGAVIAVKVPDPEFEGQTKTRLGNPEVRGLVEGVVGPEVAEALEMEPSTLNTVLGKALQAYKAAEAAKKARELVRRKSVLTKSTLPGKLADCSSSHKEETEIFVVEGDSAGGSAKQARDRVFQAVLPLRGKILNVERQDDARLYKNNEISNLIVGLGLGLKGEDLGGLRYGKIIILTDADVDGAHIRTLLLTFLFRYQRALFEQGHVYVGVPPLFKLEARGGGGGRGGGGARYLYSDEELREETQGLAPGSFTVQRFKGASSGVPPIPSVLATSGGGPLPEQLLPGLSPGKPTAWRASKQALGLGEMMPEQLWQTTLNPATRMLRKLTVDDAAEASHLFALLMGDKVAPRRALIERHAAQFNLDELDI
ncbi:hypothetical protein N2152v2_001071 [Parachlorella kessleri]